MKEDRKILMIHKVLTGEASREEEDFYVKWLNMDKENKRLAEDVKMIWVNSENIVKDNVFLDKEKIKSNIFSKIANDANLENKKLNSIPKIIRLNKIASIAAAIMLIIGAVFIYNSFFSLDIYKANDSVRFITLIDNSSVWLDENSTLKVKRNFNKNTREVILKGNAFFSISKNHEKPFIISVANNKIEVVGTAFRVITKKNGNVRVEVVSGVVKFFANSDSPQFVKLSKDQGAEYDLANNDFIPVSKADFDRDFKAKYLSFNDAKLIDVFGRLALYYNVNININCDAVKSMDGYTSPGSEEVGLEDYFSSIMKLFPVKIEKSNSDSYNISCK